MGRIEEVQPKSLSSALNLLHKTYSVSAKELDQATFLPQFSQSLHNSSSLHLLSKSNRLPCLRKKISKRTWCISNTHTPSCIIIFERQNMSHVLSSALAKTRAQVFNAWPRTAAANSTPLLGKRTPHKSYPNLVSSDEKITGWMAVSCRLDQHSAWELNHVYIHKQKNC